MVSEQIVDRFGGDESGDGSGMGAIILREGEGGGYLSLPWALDKYEREMCLKPCEAWLLKRMLKHAWDYGGLVYISFRKIEREAQVTRKTAMGYAESLAKKSYIIEVQRGDPDNSADSRIRFDVSGSLVALAVCISSDPKSKFTREYGDKRHVMNLFSDEFKKKLPKKFRIGELAELARKRGYKFDWRDFRDCFPD